MHRGNDTGVAGSLWKKAGQNIVTAAVSVAATQSARAVREQGIGLQTRNLI